MLQHATDGDRGQVTDDDARIYAREFVPALFARWAPITVDASGVSRDDRVLDVACGTASSPSRRSRGQAHVRAADVAHADETRHPRGGVREHACTWWMWVMAAGAASFFGVHFSRGKQAAAELLGTFAGTLVTDDFRRRFSTPTSGVDDTGLTG